MVSRLIVHPDVSTRQAKFLEILKELDLSLTHPDVLYLDENSKLGVESSRQIQQFLSLKPYQGKNQAVLVLAAENFTNDAQNSLLKSLEEPPTQTTILLGVASEDQLLSTILSRCQIINLKNQTPEVRSKFQGDIAKLIEESVEKRFQFIEKLEAREEFLSALTDYFRQQMLQETPAIDFLKDLIEAQKWAAANVNIRAILEYLMLKMPEG